MLYRDMMPLRPKKSRYKSPAINNKYAYGWAFLANKNTFNSPVSCRSLQTLSKLAADNTYITPNTFWHNKDRNKLTLRWLSSFVLDFDDLTDTDIILNRLNEANLPVPTFLNRTDSGVHAWYVFDAPVRAASPKVVALYDAIQQDMVKKAGADPFFVAASQAFVRVPKNTVEVSMARYSFDWFKNWREIEREKPAENYTGVRIFNAGAWFASPAVQSLLTMDVPRGRRHNSCLTLALACKADGVPEELALERLLGWNANLSDPQRVREIEITVSSAYKSRFMCPSPKFLAVLTGQEASYSKVRYITPPKPRDVRRNHLGEIAKDIIVSLQTTKLVELSQAAWAELLGVPLRSFKLVLADLRQQGIVVGICGRGRNAQSYYKLSETYLSFGPEAFLEDYEDDNTLKFEVSSVAEVDAEDSLDLAVDADTFNNVVEAVDKLRQFNNGAYSNIHLVSGVVGGSLRPPLPPYLLTLFCDYSWDHQVSFVKLDRYLLFSG